jgi:hypothetical protein
LRRRFLSQSLVVLWRSCIGHQPVLPPVGLCIKWVMGFAIVGAINAFYWRLMLTILMRKSKVYGVSTRRLFGMVRIPG